MALEQSLQSPDPIWTHKKINEYLSCVYYRLRNKYMKSGHTRILYPVYIDLSMYPVWIVAQNEQFQIHFYHTSCAPFHVFLSIFVPPEKITPDSEPTSGGPWVPEDFSGSADVGWPMSDEGILRSGDPSMMEFIADHWLTRVEGTQSSPSCHQSHCRW